MVVGDTLGPYRVLAHVGAGGMGEVYRAHDTKLARDVALKVLPAVFATDDERLARFTREAQTLAALSHPGIAAIFGIEETSGVRALVMEYVEGEDLTALIACGPVPVDDALAIARQIAEALEAAHELGIVHRDLKPANVKVRPDGTVKVLDFGLAKAADPFDAAREATAGGALDNSPTFTSPAMTQRGMILGTAAYMSPEQAKGRAVDKRADIWAFGVVLFEMLTGTRLFDGESVTETLAAVLTRDPDLATLPAGVPPRIVSLLERCLERDAKRRLRDIGEARLILSEPVRPAEPAPAAVVPISARPKRRAAVPVLCVAAGMLVGFGGVALVRGPSVSSIAAAPSSVSVAPLTSSGNVISASISPDGRYLAYVESDQGRQSLWLQQIAGGQTLRLIPEQNVFYWGHTFTPDGDSIVFGQKGPDDSRGGLYSISTLGGGPRRLLSGMDSQPTFSPDGRRMAYLRVQHPQPGQSALMIADADGANARVLASVADPEHIAGMFFGAPAWSPDGTHIATAIERGTQGAEGRSRLVLVDVQTGSMSTLSEPGWVNAAQVGWMPDGRSLLVIARAMDQVGPQIWSVSVPDGKAARVTNDLSDHRIISLTRDGRTLVTVAGNASSSASIVSLRGDGPPVRVIRSSLHTLWGVAFTPDGGLLYSTGASGFGTVQSREVSSLWLARADGSGRTRVLAAAPGELLAYPVVADAGTIFYVSSKEQGSELRATSLDGASARVLARGARSEVVSASRDGRVVVFIGSQDGVPVLFRVGPDGDGLKQITTLPSFAPAVDPSGRRVAYYFLREDGRFRLGLSSTDGGPMLADLPGEAPNTNSRLVLTDQALYLNTKTNDRANVWLQPRDGRPARRLTSFDDQQMFDFAVSRDETMLAIVRGPRLRDAQMITGFAAGAQGEASASR